MYMNIECIGDIYRPKRQTCCHCHGAWSHQCGESLNLSSPSTSSTLERSRYLMFWIILKHKCHCQNESKRSDMQVLLCGNWHYYSVYDYRCSGPLTNFWIRVTVSGWSSLPTCIMCMAVLDLSYFRQAFFFSYKFFAPIYWKQFSHLG